MILEGGTPSTKGKERLLEPVEGAALDSGGHLGVDRVEDAGLAWGRPIVGRSLAARWACSAWACSIASG